MDQRRARSAAADYQLATGIPCTVLAIPSADEAVGEPVCERCHGCDTNRHAQYVSRAAGLDGTSIYFCERSLTFWSAPIVDDTGVAGGLVAGPARMVDDEDLMPHERMIGETIAHLSPGRVRGLARMLSVVAGYVSGMIPDRFSESAAALERESRINEHIQSLKLRGRIDLPPYPLETEAAFLEAIGAGAIAQAQEHLNELLGHVFFTGGAEMHSLRSRAKELVVLLSRVAISRGADPHQILGWNYHYLDSLDDQPDINHLAAWLSRIVRRFSDTVLLVSNPGHSAPLRKAISTIRAHATDGISLEQAARAAGLSRSYFSRIFSKEVGMSFSEFHARVRVETAARLLVSSELPLAQIAERVGFTDQSYFTRVFKRVTGTTPGDYRRNNTSVTLTPFRSNRRC